MFFVTCHVQFLDPFIAFLKQLMTSNFSMGKAIKCCFLNMYKFLGFFIRSNS